MKNIKIDKIILIESLLFSAFFLIGRTIYKHGVIDPLFYNVSSLFAFLGLTLVFYIWILFLYNFLDNKKEKKKASKVYYYLFEYKPFLIPFLFFFLGGLWYIVCFYPGAVNWDGLEEINNFYGIHEWATHHPVFPTILMGLAMKLGSALIDNNFGIFIYTFIQYIISSLVFTYIINYLRKIKSPRYLIVLTFLFFLLNPVWMANGYTLIKDTYYYLFFALFVIELFEYYKGNYNFFNLLLSSFMVILFRHNGIYVVLPSLLFMMIIKQDRNYRVFIIFVLLLFSSLTVSIITLNAGIAKGNIREPLALPIEITARYIKYGDLDNEELTFYNEVFYTDLQTIKILYDEDTVDLVKSRFLLTGENYGQYAKYWLIGLKKSPKIYLDAFLANNYGYFYPYKEVFRNEMAYFDVVDNPEVNTHDFDLYINTRFQKINAAFIDYYNFLTRCPLIRLMFRPGTYTIMLILSICYALRKKQKEILFLSIPLLMTLLFCILSPLNACIRYMNPLIVTLPVLLGYILGNKCK